MIGSNDSLIYGVSNFTIGSTPITYKVDKYFDAIDDLTVKIGNTTIATRSNVTGSSVDTLTRTITFSSAELTKIYNAMPKVTKATFTFILTSKTRDGATSGSTSTTATGTIADSVVPILDEITLIENAQDIATKFGGAFIKTKSKLDYSYIVTPATGTTISSYSLILDGITYTNASGTTNILSKSGAVRYSAYVIDSRGRKSNTISGSITVLDYSPPQISTFKVVRCDANGNEDNKGLYAKYTIDASITPLNNKNDKSFNILYRQQGTDVWQVSRMISNVYSLAETGTPVKINEDSWQFRAMLFDYFNPEENPINKYYDLSSSFMFFETTENLDGIAWGKTADESNVFDIGMEKTYLSNNTYMGGNERNNDEKNIFFQTSEGATNPSNCKVYGGTGSSTTSIGMYDVDNERAIFRYIAQQSKFEIGSEMEIFKGNLPMLHQQVLVTGENSGRMHFSNGLLIQWGMVSITTTAANTPASVTITFPIPYSKKPHINVVPQTTAPQTMSHSIGQGSTNVTDFGIFLTRNAAGATNMHWLSVGFKEV